MKVPTADTAKALAILAGTGVAIFILYKAYKGSQAITETVKTIATESLNPTSTENIAYKGANILTGGSSDYPLGSRIYDWLNAPYKP